MIDDEKISHNKILVFSAYYEPEIFPSRYLLKNLCESLANNNHRVELFVPLPTRGIDDNIRKQYLYNTTEVKCNGNLIIHRFWLPKEKKNPLLRAIRYLAMNLLFIIKSRNVKADIVFVQSTPPTQGVMAAIISKLKGIPFVYNLQDVFPDSLVNAGMTKKNSLMWKIGRIVENFTYKNADKIIVISQNIKENICNKGVLLNKIEVISNWVEEDIVKPISKDNNFLFDSFNLDKELFYIVYAGSLGYAQNIDIIINSAKRISENKKIRFLIFGNGKNYELYKRMIVEQNLNNINIYSLQPYEKTSYVYGLGDACLVTCNKGTGYGAMPSKTWNIMACGKPVIANFDSNTDLEQLINANDVGIFTNCNDVDSMVEAILKYYNNPNLKLQHGFNARKYILENLTKKVGTRRYIKLLKSVQGAKNV